MERILKKYNFEEFTCILGDSSKNKHNAGKKPDANGGHPWKSKNVSFQLNIFAML